MSKSSKSGGLNKKKPRKGPSKNAKLKRSCFRTDAEWLAACKVQYKGETPAQSLARWEKAEKFLSDKDKTAKKENAGASTPPPSGTYKSFEEMSRDWFSDYNSQTKSKLQPVVVKRNRVNCTFTFVARTSADAKEGHVIVKPMNFDISPSAVLGKIDLDDLIGLKQLTIPAALASFLLEKRGLACRV